LAGEAAAFRVSNGAARRKLEILDAAISLNELAMTPGNELEQLRGGRSGQYSIRINRQWRICFEWRGRDAERVEIVDYH
jgi:proteic killer suppression protein